ncbi:MAG TPA: type II toxin-antitoxin system VapC family toxin [bacterium]|nr:type II toxin-antitoxin system VapC family toxin [Candidatus Omnitrophota bacterium]HOL96529.1 type II toxin-antitoxin system VapC family toxin [bacterium]
MAGERAFVDTNIFIYAVYADNEHHVASRKLLERAEKGEMEFCIAVQSLTEYYSVVTNLRRVSNPRSPQEALSDIQIILNLPGITVIPQPTDLLSRIITLIEKNPVLGADIFDVQLVATLLGNNIKKIYTYNIIDFQRFSELEVLLP